LPRIQAWVVLVTAEYPVPLHRFVMGWLRWYIQTFAYVFGLTDRYPPFRLAP